MTGIGMHGLEKAICHRRVSEAGFRRVTLVSLIMLALTGTLLSLIGCAGKTYSADDTSKLRRSQVIISASDCDSDVFGADGGGTSRNSAVTTGGDIIGGSIPEKIWNYCRAEGYSEEACAAILGNGEAESGFDSDAIDGTGMGDSIGIWQFTNEEKVAFLAWSGNSTSLEKQLEWMFGEPDKVNGQWIDYSQNAGLGNGTYYQGHSGVPGDISWYHTVDEFKRADDIEKATFTWMACYERCSAEYSNYASNRLANARKWYEQFTGRSSTASGAATESGKCETPPSSASLLDGGDVFFSQWEDPWGSMSYWGGTCSNCGCGPTSCAVALDLVTGKSFTPKDMMEKRDEAVGNGDLDDHYYGRDQLIPASFYNKYFGVDIATEEIADNTLQGWKDALSDGKSVIVFSRDSGSKWYTKNGELQGYQHSAGHYSVIWKYDGTHWYMKDVSQSKDEGNNIPYTDEQMAQFIAGRDHSQTKWTSN